MKVTVKLFTIQEKNRDNPSQEMVLNDGATIRSLLDSLDIAENSVGVLMVNRQSATFDQTLYNGDVVTIIPPIGGG